MLKDYFRIAVQELLHRRLRTWLTMIGIFIGIAAVVGLISLGRGLEGAITDQFKELGTDKIIIQPGGVGFGFSEKSPSPLTSEDVDVIKSVNGIAEVGSAKMKTTMIEWGKDDITYAFTIGMSMDESLDMMIQGFALEPIEGRMLRKGDYKKAYVGYDYAHNTNFGTNLRLGGKILVNGEQFEIVGFNKQMGNANDDQQILIPQDAFDDVFEVGDQVNFIFARVQEGSVPADIVPIVERDLRKHRNVNEGEEDFQVETFEQYLSSFLVIFAVVQAVIVGIAGISLVVGGIGIMNTMYTSVVERTRDIGVMKAIGARNEDIRNLFLIESGMLGLVGGTIGVLLGVAFGKSVEFIGYNILKTPLLNASIPAWLIIGSLLFAFTLGAAAGTLPAMQASKMNPVDALREE